MIVDNNITRGDFEKSLKLQGLEAFTEEQVSAWVSGTRELIEKSEREELSDIEKSSIEEFKVDVLSLKRITVVEDDLTKSTMFIRPAQVIWDVAEDGEILKARSGIYGNTPENRKLGRIGQKYGAVKGGEEKKEESKVVGLSIYSHKEGGMAATGTINGEKVTIKLPKEFLNTVSSFDDKKSRQVVKDMLNKEYAKKESEGGEKKEDKPKDTFPSKDKLIEKLISHGNNDKESRNMVEKHYDYVKRVYPDSSLKELAEIIRTIY